MKPIFCGNVDYDVRESDLERLFRRYGKVDRVDLKNGLLGVDGLLCMSFMASGMPKLHLLTNLIHHCTAIIHFLETP